MDIKAVIFDKDGTLIDFAATFNPATHRVLKQLCGEDQDLLKEVAAIWGFDLERGKVADNSIIVAGSGIDLAQAVSDVLKIEDPEEFSVRLDQMFGAICVETVEALPGVDEGLQTLHSNGLVLGIGTNDAQANAIAQMKTLGFEKYFNAILGADSGYGAKPEPGMILEFVKRYGFHSQQVMMVGDSLHDLEAGSAAGVVTCGVETGPAERSVLEKHADIVLPSVTELPEFLRNSV